MNKIYFLPNTLEKWDAICTGLRALYPNIELDQDGSEIIKLGMHTVFISRSIDSLLEQFPSLRPWKDELTLTEPAARPGGTIVS
jgi:hypothetical protein